MTVPRWLALLFACSAACSSDPDDGLGALTVALTTQAGGTSYRVTGARFVLEGEERRELSADDPGELSLSLPPGAYRLSLQDGYALVRLDDDGARVGARLVSQNPLPLQVAAGETTRAVLRFELADAPRLLDAGTLATPPAPIDVAVPVDAATPALLPLDAGAVPLDPAAVACTEGLRIDELDAEQTGSDDAELIEVVNPGRCDAPLAGVRVELINGTGGKAYGTYELGAAGVSLPAGTRLVIGDPAIIEALPAGVLALPLRGSGLQNGPDAVRLRNATRVLDAIAYGGAVVDAGEGQPTRKDDEAYSLSRCPSGRDSDDNAADFQLTPPTPGAPGACAAEAPTQAARDAGAQNRSATMPSSSSQR